MDWVAAENLDNTVGWQYVFVDNPKDCCIACYTNNVATNGCLAWYWDPYQEGEEFYCTNYQYSSSLLPDTSDENEIAGNKDRNSNGEGSNDINTCSTSKEMMNFNWNTNNKRPEAVADIGPCGKERVAKQRANSQ